jgi:hypothetical protein
MYGPNYVKLSRVFAVQLFSMFIVYWEALAMPRCPRSDSTPIGPTAMPSPPPPPFASPSPMHYYNTHCSGVGGNRG